MKKVVVPILICALVTLGLAQVNAVASSTPLHTVKVFKGKQGKRGPRGRTGKTGPQGIQGEPGSGLTGIVRVKASAFLASGTETTPAPENVAVVRCPEGTRVLNQGFDTSSGDKVRIITFTADYTRVAASVRAVNENESQRTAAVFLYVLCAPMQITDGESTWTGPGYEQ